MRFCVFLFAATLAAQPANERFLKWMDQRAQSLLAERDKTIAAIKTPAQIAERKRHVRETILKLIGGLPDYKGSLNAKVTWTKQFERYIVEGVLYESLPDYWVSANLYRPKAPGKYPAVLFPMGHWDQGKPAAQRLAVNLALKGFVVLAFDPVGQGERLQAYDARVGKSLAGGSTEQHFQAGALAVLAGENVARYFIWDGMRGIDYLQSRPEVDGEKIGVTGCSGGGTQTTYISALDPRVKVAAPACYMQSFKLLFSGPVGDSEQSFPNFLSSGLDQTDYVELFAPKPWLIANTEQDFFTPAAAKIVYEEARNWYEMQGAQDRIKWVVGPGGHGTPLIVREAIYEWMIRWLKDGSGSAKEEDATLLPDFELRVTPNGRVPGREISTIIREHIPSNSERSFSSKGMEYDADSVLLEGSGDTAVVVVETGKLPGKRAKQIAEKGVTVLALNPRGLPVEPYRGYSGDWAANERSWLIGANLPMMRAYDIAQAVKTLRERPGVKRVMVHASGVSGWWAIYATSFPGIDRLWLDRTPHSLRAAFDGGVHTDLHDAVIPGNGGMDVKAVLAQSKAMVLWTDPTDWMRNVVNLQGDYVYRNVVVDDDDQRIIDLFLKR